eukprot:TRINITY_DN7042_c0_g1_i1.p1 TRINITY_DN7042_c0_g1~~TRINITY_DN7042_c0_g1_i1.p1  ORF type:complete len:198 (-),score=43.09 TRINITY_DN7042_c0_g1_i1:352-945(-)
MFFQDEDHPMHLILGSPGAERGNLYLGDYTAAIDLYTLKELNIKHVLSLIDLEGDLYEPGTVEHLVFHTDDEEDYMISLLFDRCIEFIDRAMRESNILVHCAAGVSRSPCIVMAYLIKKHNKTVAEAYAMCREKRNCVMPNPGFVRQLHTFEALLRAPNALELEGQDFNGNKGCRDKDKDGDNNNNNNSINRDGECA